MGITACGEEFGLRSHDEAPRRIPPEPVDHRPIVDNSPTRTRSSARLAGPCPAGPCPAGPRPARARPARARPARAHLLPPVRLKLPARPAPAWLALTCSRPPG
ncbi:hypothetical protein S1361_17140 [Streptomyces cyanogenus]|uniref:Uncharacterized protein n=1 Tax=Streptomyces cyanogenus TaxID=80860 RepID=A0ABX7TQT9_STRCY|nr:hypothetical protein S1361_17140 [Streptomyces cyanogenus]